MRQSTRLKDSRVVHLNRGSNVLSLQRVNVDNQALPVSPLAQINFGTSQIFGFLRSRFGLKFGRVRREQNLCPSVFAANYRACRDMAGDRPD